VTKLLLHQLRVCPVVYQQGRTGVPIIPLTE
jgi:hypothetical protein